jgi:hypothetical protein
LWARAGVIDVRVPAAARDNESDSNDADSLDDSFIETDRLLSARVVDVVIIGDNNLDTGKSIVRRYAMRYWLPPGT